MPRDGECRDRLSALNSYTNHDWYDEDANDDDGGSGSCLSSVVVININHQKW